MAAAGVALACVLACAVLRPPAVQEGGAEAVAVADIGSEQGRIDVVDRLATTAETEVVASEAGVADRGREVLEAYRDRGGCVLAQSGYLDLSGRVWTCVLEGEGWVDICVVREDSQTGGSTTTVMHLDAQTAAAELGL